MRTETLLELCIVGGIGLAVAALAVTIIGAIDRRGGWKWVYPPHDRSTVFMMAILLLVLIGSSAGAREFLTKLVEQAAERSLFAGTLVVVTLAAPFLAAFAVPFVKSELRGLPLIVVLLNALVVLAASIAVAWRSAQVYERWLNWAFALYFAGWLVVAFSGTARVISKREPQDPAEPFVVAGLAALFFLGGIHLLDMRTLTAYSFAIAMTPSVYLALQRIVRLANPSTPRA